MNDFSISPVPSCHQILFSLVTRRHVGNFCSSVKKIQNRAKKLHTFATFWSHLCQKLAYFKKSLEHGKFKEWYHVKEERLFYLFLTFWKFCYVYFDHTKPCCKLLRQTSKIEKLQTTFRMVLLFQGLPLNNYGVECKENIPCKRWGNFRSVTYLCVITLVLF